MVDLQKSKLNLEIFCLFLLASCSQQIVKKEKVPILETQPKISYERHVLVPEEDEETLIDSSHEILHSYFLGLQERNKGNFEKAVEFFTHFVTENPNHVYADRAQYLILDCYHLNQEFNQLILASFFLEKQFPESRKLPEAMYKRGLAYLNLGQGKMGEITLKTVAASFPQNPVSQLAQEKLGQIKTHNGNL
jgi:TolA-binding protein